MGDLYTTLKNFLAAGTLTFHISDLPQLLDSSTDCADDGWAAFSLSNDSGNLPKAVGACLDERERDVVGTMASLRFLVHHHFVRATYRADSAHGLLFVRVYIIPWDLPGSKGVLRARDEDSVLRPGRKHLKALILRVRQDRSLWEGEGDGLLCSTPRRFWEHIVDNRTLLDIYNDLPSPDPQSLIEEIPGLMSTLYGYQRRTVSTMVARETFKGSVEDPLYLPIQGMDGKTFYMLPATMEIVTERPRVSSVPGGILCEELGTGKTVMMLSLILATVDQLSAPEEAFHEERIPMTPVALRHFQTSAAIAEREKLAKNKVLRNTGVPSLVEFMLHQCRIAPDRLALREHEEHLESQGLLAPLRANVPFYLHTDPPRDVGYGAARGANSGAPRIMYLTTATLVVVPDNLQLQWASEIMKHTTDRHTPSLLRVLMVNQKDELPDAPILCTDYDVILLAHSRFSKEAKKKAVDDLATKAPCQCRPLRGSRIPLCRCSRRDTVSPLLQIRWKRLVVDEGHNTAEKRTDYAVFTKLLSVERRWIVTGTPTTNLLGLNFGSGSDLQYPEDEDGESGSEDDTLVQQRRWHSSERADFYKLGTMFADFLLMMPFASDPQAFSAFVSNPIFDPDGPWPGEIQVLTQVMASVMVRHRIEDVEQDVRLPFLEHETVLLNMDPYAVKTYNLIQATIAINAVDSERKDQDYFFHPRNVGPLQELVTNISHIMFWHVVDTFLHERLANAERCLQKLAERNGSPEDFELMKQAIFHLYSAMNDPVWMALQGHYNVFHRVEKLPLPVYHAWSMFPDTAREACTSEFLIPPMALIKMRDYVTKHPLRTIAHIAQMGQSVLEEERKWKEYEALRNHLKKKGPKERRPKDEAARDSLKFLKRETAKKKLEEMRMEYQAAATRLTAASTAEAAPVRAEGGSQHTVASTLLRLSPVAGVRIRNSTSTKLDYILNEVLLHSTDEKFLIFSQSPSTLAFIAEALDLVMVKYLEFSGKLKREHRQTTITTFDTSDLYRVLLMDLKHGARGLNLVAASRVIFCEPVWKADVESQAIKRVHRIGQSRRVMVKTLAIRGSSEEVMVARSKALKENKQEFAKEITDDRTIRSFIEHPTFLPVPTERVVNLDVPLFQLAPLPTNGTGNSVDPSPSSAAPRNPEVRVVVAATPPLPRRSTVYVEITTEPPRKKQKMVSFAD